ncbi:MAG TPA: acyl-CoA dehydrogenase family protein, partial [Pyrinomonadaceae bacterium]|nr:acyl-CoA dehydrogenase family protein [Pyrinomonadaceae bacterium]
MDRLVRELPFFTTEHRNLADGVAQFVAQEIEPHAGVEDDVEGLARHFVNLLAGAGILNYVVAESKLDVRALCLIREALAYSSALADVAFVM